MKVTEGWMIVFKASLYFGAAFLPPVIDCLASTAIHGYWPSLPAFTVANAQGLLAGIVALRAYTDSSHSRYVDAQANKGALKEMTTP